MNVVSLFYGMSCGQIALKELGVKVDNYFASEVDKFAIAQTQLNFPNTIKLGDVTKVDVSKLPKVDLLIGGSPCQSFSFAGKRKGMSTKCNEEIYTLERYLELKENGFEFEGQSYLFWEYMRILTELRKANPGIKFLLENVEMSKKWERVLSEAIGVFGVHINSALVSAQNRKRIYWTNIRVKEVGLFGELHSDIPQPKDIGILLKDILQHESEIDEKYYLSDKLINSLNKHAEKRQQNFNLIGSNGKSKAITVSHLKQNLDSNYICVSMVGRKINEQGKRDDYNKDLKAIQRLEPNENGKTNCITTVQKDNLLTNGYKLRRLTPLECSRLQTIPEWYRWECSDTQQYKMLGNGWTVEVIKHIFSFLK